MRDYEEENVVRIVTFAKILDEPEDVDANQDIDLVDDALIQIVAELGRTRMTVNDVLRLAIGSVIELDKLAGETVDLLVDGRVAARGEIVAVDDYFAVRIIEILAK